MDELTAHIEEEVPWCILFVDDLVLVNESRDCVNLKFEGWRETLEFKGFKISCTKIEYMHPNFSGEVQSDVISMRIEAQDTPQREGN